MAMLKTVLISALLVGMFVPVLGYADQPKIYTCSLVPVGWTGNSVPIGESVGLELKLSGFGYFSKLSKKWSIVPGPGSIKSTPGLFGIGTSATDFEFEVPSDAVPGHGTDIELVVTDDSGMTATCDTHFQFIDAETWRRIMTH